MQELQHSMPPLQRKAGTPGPRERESLHSRGPEVGQEADVRQRCEVREEAARNNASMLRRDAKKASLRSVRVVRRAFVDQPIQHKDQAVRCKRKADDSEAGRRQYRRRNESQGHVERGGHTQRGVHALALLNRWWR